MAKKGRSARERKTLPLRDQRIPHPLLKKHPNLPSSIPSTFERLANSVLAQFRRSPAAARIGRQADAATAAAARALPPPVDPNCGGSEDDSPSTSAASSHGFGGGGGGAWGGAALFAHGRSALNLVGWGDRASHDATGGGRYGGDFARRTSLEDEAGVVSYAALHRPAGRNGVPPWWSAAWRAGQRRARAWRAARDSAAEAARAAKAAAAPPRAAAATTTVGRWLAARRSAAAARSLTATRAIAFRAAWARRYARANTVGLRKIVKKYGKMCGDPDAGRLLQVFWAGDSRRARTGFLTSPLVAELRVVEVLLSHDRAVTLAGEKGGGGRGAGGPPTPALIPPADTAEGVAPSQELAAPAPAHLLAAHAHHLAPAPPPPPPPRALTPEEEAAAAAAAARRAAKGKAPLVLPPVASEEEATDSDKDGGVRPAARPRPVSAPARPSTHGRAPARPPLAAAWAEPPGGSTSAAAAAAIERGVGVVPFCPDEALFEDDDDDDDDEDDEDDDEGEEDGDGDGEPSATSRGAWYGGGGGGRPKGQGRQSTAASLLGRTPSRPGGAALGPASPPRALGLSLVSPPASSAGDGGGGGGGGGGGRGGGGSAASGSRRTGRRGSGGRGRVLARVADAAALDEVLDADAVPSAAALSVEEGSSVAGGSPRGLTALPPPPPPLSAVSAATAAAARPVAPHLRCPICLDALFRPLGLGCGHCFCTDCALASAGQGNAIGRLAARLAALDRDTPCPGCRRPGAFVDAVPMLHTSALVRLRHPRAWAERRAEAACRAAQQRRALDRRADRQSRKWKGRGVTAFDLLRVPSTEIF